MVVYQYLSGTRTHARTHTNARTRELTPYLQVWSGAANLTFSAPTKAWQRFSIGDPVPIISSIIGVVFVCVV